jgi:hypothetical protein
MVAEGQSGFSRALVVLTLAFAIALSTVPSAHAGDYHVYSCRTPSGESAPADGWTGSVLPSGSTDVYATNTCASGGALTAAIGMHAGHIANLDQATWAFAAPPSSTIAAATLWRAGDTHGDAEEHASYLFSLAGSSELTLFDECDFSLECFQQGEVGVPAAPPNLVLVPKANLGTNLYARAACGVGLPGKECPTGLSDPNGYAAAIYLYAADITLAQSAGPTATNVGGELASALAVAGTSDVTFSASDPGAGVYQAVFYVDGSAVQRSIIDANGGRCNSVGTAGDGTPAFLYVQPCPGSVSADVPFDTARVANGVHHLVVDVIDAAGNAAPVLDRNVVIANAPGPGPPNGTNASANAVLSARWQSTRRTSLTSRFGRPHTVIGRLAGPSGLPIAGALIAVETTPSYAGAQARILPGARTDGAGRFSLKLAASLPSSRVRLAYSPNLGNSSPVAERTLRLTVRAGVSLTVAPRTASAGGRIFFSGRLRGGPIPASGKQLVLEARSPGSRWLEFDVVRSNRRGGFRSSYQFKFPGPANYQFRVLSEPESDYPFAAGTSNVVDVFER